RNHFGRPLIDISSYKGFLSIFILFIRYGAEFMENNLEQIMTITSTEIEKWADSIKARSHLPVLLRKLIHSTCSQLGYVDFPGYDNSQRQGSDGIIKEAIGNSWVPKGDSYW